MTGSDRTVDVPAASPLAWILQLPIRLYRLVPRMQDRCRYHPTCSAYALEALRVHGGFKGLYLTTRRLLRCHPWGGTGLDPVPPRKNTDTEHTFVDTAVNRAPMNDTEESVA
ncbi:membrane protein insertion efficiency factor YidD [Euzebya tangerina]|uniref:membrane protein insertion efficiency factor YidD n=1 Tax=Euzebya tangerina TaxID=591198 RepID=UPI001F0C82A9|nr:membrane protein insertion efficiency factor YidD [Euzebya tangerina]